jgi:hypothetical protein
MQQQQQHTNLLATNYISIVFMNTCLAQLQTFTIQESTTMNPYILDFKVPGSSIPIVPVMFMFILIHYKIGFLSHWLENLPAFPLEFPESKIKKQKLLSAFSIFFFSELQKRDESKIKQYILIRERE